MVFPIAGGTQSTGYDVDNSVRFDGNAVLARTPSSGGNRRTWTWSCWLKKCKNATRQEILSVYGATNNDDHMSLRFDSDDKFTFAMYSSDIFTTTQLFRDTHAWFHMVLAVDTTQGTDSNRVKLYINGTQVTNFGANNLPSQNKDFALNHTFEHEIGRLALTDNYEYNGYMAEVNLIDGSQYDPTYFGKFNENNVWVPVKPGTGAGGAVTYGTNGFFLEFQQTGTSQNSSGIGADTSGNDHHFAPTQLGSIDITSDTCTNNWCTMSNLYSDKQQGGAITFSQGLTEITTSYVDANYQRYPQAMSSIAVTKGKWYFEMKPSSGSDFNIGVFSPEDFASDSTTNPYGGYAATGVIYTEEGEVRQNDSTDSGHASYGTSDIVGCALDMDNNAVYFHKNNTYINSGNATSGASKTGAFTLPTTGENGLDITLYGFVMGEEGAGGTGTMLANFGQPPYTPSSIENDANGFGNFEYAPPSGYFALCTKNLAEFG